MIDDLPSGSAERQAWYIGQLVSYLEGRLHFLPPNEYAILQEKIDGCRRRARPGERVDPPFAHVSVENFLSLATPRMWALAHAMVDVRRGLEPSV